MNACHEPGEVPALGPGDSAHLDHRRRLGLVLLLGWSALVGSGCTPETFRVEHREPAPDSNDVAAGAPIQAHFDAPLEPSSLREERVHLKTRDGQEVAKSLQLSEDGRVLTVVPTAPLQTAQGYELMFDPGLKSVHGGELDVATAQWGWYVPAWLRVGEEMWGGTRRFIDRPQLTFDGEGAPVVVWNEEFTQGVGRIFVRRWDGGAWRELGPSSPEMSTELVSSDAIALERGPAGQLWMRWWERDPQRNFITHLATWDGASWQRVWSSPVGERSLGRLRVGPSNQPVGLFAGRVKRFRDGHWEDLGSPPVPAGGGAAAIYSLAGLMVDAHDRPLLAEATAATAEVSGGTMRLSRWDSGAWQVLGELPASPRDPTTGRPPDITVLGMEADPLERPLLAWTESQSYCVRTCIYFYQTHFHRWNDGGWASAAPTLNTLPSGFAVEPSGALLIGSADRVEDPPGSWDYLVRRAEGPDWGSIGSMRETSDSPPLKYVGGDLVVRPNGVPCVAYVEESQEGNAVRVACHNR
jgi:hypothetical protein